MALLNTTNRWGGVSKTLHWLMAVMLVGALTVGLIMNDWPDDDPVTKARLYHMHQSFGMLLLLLVLVRLGWRSTQAVPAPPAGSWRLTRRAAAISHGLLYASMLLIPVTGYLMVSSGPHAEPFYAFGLVHVPFLIGPNETLQGVFRLTHDVLTKLFMVLIIIHVLAAMKHGLVNRDGVWSRMWFGRRQTPDEG
ncbi:MAG: cytochrome b [Geminicoccaceae bacterium]|nr:MAG: cytochrome b [Geminicoccaceae bacterium]